MELLLSSKLHSDPSSTSTHHRATPSSANDLHLRLPSRLPVTPISLFLPTSTLTTQRGFVSQKRICLLILQHKAAFGRVATIPLSNLQPSLLVIFPSTTRVSQAQHTFRPTMSSSRTRRIAKEVADIHSDNLSNIKADPVGNGDDLTHLKGSFKGPPGTPYEGGTYTIDVKIPNDYPFRPPVMKFDTKVWHPNVSSQTVSECPPLLNAASSRLTTEFIGRHLP